LQSLSLIGLGITAFAATNIDDIVVLMVFFSSNFQAQNIVIGQYLGIGSLIAISALGSLIALVVPSYIVGLMGLLPIAIGIKELLEIWRNNNNSKREEEEISKEKLLTGDKGGYLHHHRYLSSLSFIPCCCGCYYFKRG
jgi:cadmium resistance protein CadD (predicted permease)